MYLKSMCRGIMKEMEVFPLKHTITQLLLSISILLSLVYTLTWSSLTSSSLVYYQNLHYFSSNTMNKNFFFLICNAILFFLAKTSPSARPPDLDDLLQKRTGNGLPLPVVVEAETYSDKHIKLDEEEDDDEDEESTKVFEEEQVKVDHEIEHSSEDDEIELQDCFLFKEADDRDEEIIGNGGEEVDEIEKLSDDELNKKFEDFIRRMKEEFRINDYQHKQLILVK